MKVFRASQAVYAYTSGAAGVGAAGPLTFFRRREKKRTMNISSATGSSSGTSTTPVQMAASTAMRVISPRVPLACGRW
jgi:hypothetical protein